MCFYAELNNVWKVPVFILRPIFISQLYSDHVFVKNLTVS